MPMDNRLLRPRQTIHPEAADWANRVRTNGGSVSGTTLTAVDRFVKAVYAAGIRDRLYRVNLFAGTGLSACLVPLFRSASFGGMAYGNATDTAINFVAGDYTEATGLTGNGTNKYLQTGLQTSAWITGGNIRSHIAVYKRTSAAVGSSGILVSSRPVSPVRSWEFGAGGHSLGEVRGLNPLPTPYDSFLCATTTDDITVIGSRNTSFNSAITYAATMNASSVPFAIFCRNGPAGDTNTYSPAIYSNQTLAAYSIGSGLTQAEVLSYNTIMQAFQTALARNV